MPSVSYVCRIAFASNPFDGTPVWTDVSSELMSFHIRRGRQWELNRMEAGTATVRLKNIAGNYWPNNTTSSYYPNVLPWKRVNLRATYGATTYDLYTGYVESWQPTFIQEPITAAVMDLSCADGIKSLSRYNLNNTTGYAQEASGTRIDNVLTALGWPTTARNLDTGQSPLQSTGPLANVNAMSHLFTVQDTELGIMYITPSGDMAFQDRHARLNAPYTTSQVTFGDTISTDRGYTKINLAYEDLRIFNDLRVTRLNGTEQVVTSTTSIDSYGTRTFQHPSLLMVTDAEAKAHANYLLARYKSPTLRCKQITIKPNSDPTNLYAIALGYDISTRITIKLSDADLNMDYHIEGIYHDWDVKDPEGLKTTWMLADAVNQSAWILGSTTDGVLDSTTMLSF